MVNGGWSSWSAYSKCSKSCAGGQQSRSRTCTKPKPQGSGKKCKGVTKEQKKCNTSPCTSSKKT